MQTTPLDIATLLTGLGGGLALFLYGMRKMTDSLKVAAGGSMKRLLERLTTNRFTAALAGATVTAVIQSSSVTTVMVVGFVTAGLLSFSQSIGVIMGANIGTTVTAQIIAFKITDYALVMIAGGFLVELLAKRNRTRHLGIMVMGLGLLFFGMQLMSDAALPLRGYAPFIGIMQELRNPLLGILAGMVFTALVQSSSATTGIVIVLASQGLIPLEAGIALIFGANVGTCVTALLAAIGKPREAVKAATVHVIFNLGGVLLFVAFIPQFADLVRELSPQFPALTGKEQLAAEVPRQIANAHTLFNVAVTLIFLGFTGTLARLADRLVPPAKSQLTDIGRSIYLQPMFLDQPALALDRVRQETGRLADLALAMVERSLPSALSADAEALEDLRVRDQQVDNLHGEIVDYLGRISLKDLVETEPEQIQYALTVCNYLENVADVVETAFVTLGQRRLEGQVALDDDLRDLLVGLHGGALDALRDAITAYTGRDADLARKVLASKDEFNRRADHVTLYLGRSVSSGGRITLRTYRIGLDLADNLKRLHTLARRIARTVRQNASARGDETRADVNGHTATVPRETA